MTLSMLSLIHDICEYNKSVLFQFLFIVDFIKGQWTWLLHLKNGKNLFCKAAMFKELGPDTFT